jgi:hypothetical protein
VDRKDMGTSDSLKSMQELEAVGLAVSHKHELGEEFRGQPLQFSTPEVRIPHFTAPLPGTPTISLVSDSGKGIGHGDPLPSSCRMRLHVSPQAQVAKRQYFAHSVTFFHGTSFLISW